MEEIRRTPLFDVHRRLGARFVEFAGWQMPVRYSGLMEEHRAVRSSCGLFDVSHMGEIEVSGTGALEAVSYITTNDPASLSDGQCQYTLICNERGGVKDDTILYRIGPETYLFCVNASNTEKVYGWIRANVPAGVKVANVSDAYAQIAIQGPRAEEVIGRVSDTRFSDLKGFHFTSTVLCGEDVIVSRTGYTGEDGFEIYLPPSAAPRIWQALMDAGSASGILPCGLGARDSLRLEMGYPLYGCELDEDTTPVEAGLKRFISLKKGDFMGRAVIARQMESRGRKKLVGFEMEEDGIPRAGYRILKNARLIGTVTSGTFSPSLNRPIGMGYVEAGADGMDGRMEIDVEVRGKGRRARIVRPPFYRHKERAAGVC